MLDTWYWTVVAGLGLAISASIVVDALGDYLSTPRNGDADNAAVRNLARFTMVGEALMAVVFAAFGFIGVFVLVAPRSPLFQIVLVRGLQIGATAAMARVAVAKWSRVSQRRRGEHMKGSPQPPSSQP